MIYASQLALRMLKQIFLKRIRIEGELPAPGPFILVSSHLNCYIDFLTIFPILPYIISPIVAEVSAKQFVTGFMFKLVNSIVVSRPVDHSFQGTGEIYSEDSDLLGINTKFLQELKPGMIIEAHGVEAAVIQVELNTKAKCSGFISARPIKFKVQPKLDNSGMFSKVFEKLINKSPVAICPEGRSHETPGTIKFKSGVGKIILNALEADIPVEVYVIGTNYTHPEYIKPTATMCFSQKLVFTKDLLLKDERTAIREIVNRIHYEMKQKVVNMKNYEQVKLVYFTNRLLFDKENKGPWSGRWREIEGKFNFVREKEEKRFREVMEAFSKYKSEVDAVGVSKYFGDGGGLLWVIGLALWSIFLSCLISGGMLAIWINSFYIEFMSQKAILGTLMNINFRNTCCDLINSNRAVYVIAFYPAYFFFLSIMFYLKYKMLLFTILFNLSLYIYFIFSFSTYFRISKYIKSIRTYFLKSHLRNALTAQRSSLEAQLNLMLS